MCHEFPPLLKNLSLKFQLSFAGENSRLNQINFWNNSTFHVLLSSRIQSGHSEKLNIKKLPKTRLRGKKCKLGFWVNLIWHFWPFLVIALTQTRMYLSCVRSFGDHLVMCFSLKHQPKISFLLLKAWNYCKDNFCYHTFVLQ